MAHGFAVWGGPVATVIASLSAAGVAGTFGYFQYHIARTQRDIAYEKLKLDLYTRRYPVYELCRRALDALTSPPTPPELVDPLDEISEDFEKLQADFLFSEETLDFITEVEDLVSSVRVAQHLFDTSIIDSEAYSQEQTRIFTAATNLEDGLGAAFAPELGFGHLRKTIGTTRAEREPTEAQLVRKAGRNLFRYANFLRGRVDD